MREIYLLEVNWCDEEFLHRAFTYPPTKADLVDLIETNNDNYLHWPKERLDKLHAVYDDQFKVEDFAKERSRRYRVLDYRHQEGEARTLFGLRIKILKLPVCTR